MSDKPEVPVLPAATILMLRDSPEFQVLMVKRHHQIDFASGALVFPGGKSHAGDHDPAWAEHVLGWDAYDAEQRGLRIAAIREVFEEAGILLARRRDGQPMSGEACPMDVRAAVDTYHSMEFDGGARDLERFQERMLQRFLTQPETAARDDVDYLLDKMDQLSSGARVEAGETQSA